MLSGCQILTIPIGMQWCVFVILISTSLTTYDIKHLFVCLMPSEYLFGEVSVVRIFCLFWFLLLNFKASLHILDNNIVSDVTFANIFSVTRLLESKLSIISFVYCVFSVSKMTSSYSKLSRFSPMIFSRRFTVLCFAIRSMTRFEGIFVKGVRSMSIYFYFLFFCVESKSAHFFHLHLHFLKSTLDSKLAILSQWAPQVLKKMLLGSTLPGALASLFFLSFLHNWMKTPSWCNNWGYYSYCQAKVEIISYRVIF